MIESPKETKSSKTVSAGTEQYNSNRNNNSPQTEIVDESYMSPVDHVTIESESHDTASGPRSFETPIVLSVLNTVYDL